MALTLVVATYQNLPPSRPMSAEFGLSGGTIGRGPTNDLILPDPLQFISRVQARVEYREGAYFLVDQGRNAVHLNGKPVVNGRASKLAEGDRLLIGDYTVTVQIAPDIRAPEDSLLAPRAGATPTSLPGELLGDSLDVHGSVRPIGEPINAFGMDLGGGRVEGREGRFDPLMDRAEQLLPSGTQRDHLPDIHAPLPPARPGLDPRLSPNNESSLLDGLDGEGPPPQHMPARDAPAAVPARTSGTRGVIPDEFNPFSQPGTRQPEPTRQPGKRMDDAKSVSPAPSIAGIPDDFDPSKKYETSPADEPAPARERRQDAEPAPKPPSQPAVPDDRSLLRGLQGIASELPQPPVKSAPAKAELERFRGTSTDPWAETMPTERPSVATLLAAAAARGDLQVNPSSPMEEVLAVGYARALRELLAGAGVPDLTEKMTANTQPLRVVGELLGMVIVGIRRVLEARALTKREMRVDMTMIHQRRNNPLKVCPTATEALEQLLAPRAGDAYLPRDEAVIEAFEDLQAHHMAVMAGMRAALQSVLRRYDPAQLEKQLEAHPLLDKVLPMNRKARMWDLLTALHNRIQRESEDEFDRLFGQYFRAAYEDQIQKLRGMRKRDAGRLQ